MLKDILSKSAVCIDLKAKKKEDALKELVKLLGDAFEDKKAILKGLIERESLGSTGVGQGIAVPHTRSEKSKEIIAALGISKQGIDFNSLDGEPVYIFFLLVAPKESAGPHLKALARVSRILRDSSFCGILRGAKTEEDVYNLIIKEDEKNN